jgi:hypothetical protein
MAAKIIKCRKGDPCNFTVTFPGVLTSAFTQAKFQARETFSEDGTAVVSIDETSGISFDYPNEQVIVQIPVSVTEAIAVGTKQREVPALLRVYDPLDADAVFSLAIPFLLLPETVDD